VGVRSSWEYYLKLLFFFVPEVSQSELSSHFSHNRFFIKIYNKIIRCDEIDLKLRLVRIFSGGAFSVCFRCVRLFEMLVFLAG
jgi:hypothetical protein